MSRVKAGDLDRIELNGLVVAPSQVWRGVRLVPLLRENVRGDLRLTKLRYGDEVDLVDLGKCAYASFIPHGLVVDWSDDGTPLVAFGAQLVDAESRRRPFAPVRILHRMVKRTGDHRLRFLPLHLAMEGFLTFQFDGPDVAWSEYSASVMSDGLSPRWETSYAGSAIPGMEDALRVFEIHENQVGVLVFVANALASAFVVPHPDDYRSLHRSLLEDFYGELLVRYGIQYPNPISIDLGMRDDQVASLADLRTELAKMRSAWADAASFMAGGILAREVVTERRYRLGPFELLRFRTSLQPHLENHIGEMILRQGGEVEYLKTYRLTDAQVKRAYLLDRLSYNRWNLQATAASFKMTPEAFVLRLEKAGFGYILKEHVLKEARKKAKGG